MKTIKKLMLLAALLLSPVFLKAQSQEPIFFIVETMKTMPGKSAEYVKTETEIWKKLHQERIKRGLIVSWNLYQVRYPSGTGVAYDYVTVTTTRGMKNVENPWGSMFADAEKFLGKEQYTKAMNIGLLRDLTNASLFQGQDYVAADPKSTKLARYQMINMMKVKEGMGEECRTMEMNIVKPVHVEMMKSGGKAAWGLYTLVMPNGESQPFNYVTSDFYNTWEDISASGGDFLKTLEKVHPGMSPEYYNKRIDEARSLVNQELWELIDHVQ